MTSTNDPNTPIPMDPQLKSLLTTIALSAATAIGTWMVKGGILPAVDLDSFSKTLVAIASGIAVVGIAYWKRRNVSQAALIKTVNADPTNGVKVVAADAIAKQVDAPITTTVMK